MIGVEHHDRSPTCLPYSLTAVHMPLIHYYRRLRFKHCYSCDCSRRQELSVTEQFLSVHHFTAKVTETDCDREAPVLFIVSSSPADHSSLTTAFLYCAAIFSVYQRRFK